MAGGRTEAKLVIKLQAQTSQLTKDLAKAQSRLRRFQGGVNKIGASIRSTMLTAFGGAAIMQGLRAAIGSLSDFEFTMDKVAAVSGAAGDELLSLERNALTLGRTSSFTAGEIANLQLQLSKVGFSSTDIVNATDAVRQLALVTDEDLGDAAKSMAGTLKGFNMNARESGKVANIMAESFSKTALTLEKFTVGTANSGAIANALGVTLEANTSRLGTLVNANIDASKAGTDLRKIYIELNKAGIDYNDALDMVAGASDKVGVATELVGIRAAGALAILSVQREKVDELTTSLSDNKKELGDMVNIMEDNLLTDWKKFTSSIDGLIQKGKPAGDAIRYILQSFTEANNKISKGFLDDTLDELDNIAKVLGTTQGALDTYGQKITVVEDKMAVLNIAMAKSANRGLTWAGILDVQKKSMLILTTKLADYKQRQEDITGAIKDSEAATIKEAAAIKLKASELAKLAARDQFKSFSSSTTVGDTDVVGDQSTGLNPFSITADDMRAGIEEQNMLWAEYRANWSSNINELLFINEGARATVSASLAGVFESIGSALGGGGDNMTSGFQKVLGIIAGGMKQVGSAMIAWGVAQKLFQDSLKSLNPFVAIAAGGALVAAGSALAASNKGMASSASGGGGGSASGSFTAREAQSINLTIDGTLRADGRSLVAVLDQQTRTDSRNR